jgi:predicted enzyme related to lactoylglutathione lyase
MTHRERSPIGAPCWADLWTSDVEGSVSFYSRLFGWQAQEPSPEFHGYFMFTRDGVPVAGAMGDIGDMAGDNSWKIYLNTPDVATALGVATSLDAEVMTPPMPVAGLGVQAVLRDPTGAIIGAWQPGTFQGFSVLEEDGTPSWFELHTRDHAGAVAFYQEAFDWRTTAMSDTAEFRYTTMNDPESGGQLAGIMDARGFLPEGLSAMWQIYWHVDDVDRSVDRVQALGGSVESSPYSTPFGRIASVADPCGARFKLRSVTS